MECPLQGAQIFLMESHDVDLGHMPVYALDIKDPKTTILWVLPY